MGQGVKWALVDAKTTEPFHDGIACFKERNMSYGGIDRNGKVVIQPIYDDSFSFKNGAAIVRLKGKNGIINVAGVYLLKPEYKYIREQNEAKGLYEVEDSVGNRGLFFNNRLILPCKYKFLSTYLFPIIDVTEQNGSNYCVNIMNGSIYKNCTFQGNLLMVENKEITDYYLRKSGEQIKSSLLSRSSKGLEVYYEEETKMYGLKNGRTGQIITPPRYFKNRISPVWYHDVMILRMDTIPDAVEIMLDANGNEIIRGQEGQTISVIDDKYVWVSDKYSIEKDNCMGLYTIDGKIILPVKYYIINPIMDDWFQTSITPYPDLDLKLYNAKSKRFYDGGRPECSEGMFITQTKKNNRYFYGYVNAETEYEIPAKYSEATPFSGGLAIVKQDDKTFAIDKRGNTVLRENDRFSFRAYRDEGFSEGVVGAYDKVSYSDGYIYNPLGSKGYTYNTTGTASDETVKRWMTEGDKLYEAKKYVDAKDYYYRVLMSSPSNVDALNNYGACLDNMGYYDEAIEAYQMALDIDPTYSYAKNNLQNSLENKRAREEAESESYADNSSKSGTFWDALSSFCSVLGNMMGSSTTYTYENSFSNGNSNYGSGSSAGNASSYRNEYARWEQRAQANYQSLTNSGYSVRQSNGNRKGGTLQGMNGGNYVQMKKALRDAQREMRNIRQRAQRNGITIAQSSWENATVGY